MFPGQARSAHPVLIRPTRIRSLARFAFLACLALGLGGVAALPALAHHGWSWAEEAQSTLTGTIQSVSMDPPHPGLEVVAEDGTLWEIDLANPRQTERSGFTGDSARPGDAITILGNRSLNPAEKWMKAVRITVNGQTFDLYPDRIKAE